MTVYLSIPGVRPDPVQSQIDLFFAELGLGVNPERAVAPRLSELKRLHAMSDARLAELGVRRDQITAHVFRDRFHR